MRCPSVQVRFGEWRLCIRADTVCNFLEGSTSFGEHQNVRLIYRHYATLYFIFAVDQVRC